MPANKHGRGSHTQCPQPFVYRRPCNQSASPSVPTQIQPAPSTQYHSSSRPVIVTPIPTPVLQPFIPPQIQSDSSSGTLKLTGQVHQTFLPEVLYLGPGIPTCNSAKLQAFVNHCQLVLLRPGLVWSGSSPISVQESNQSGPGLDQSLTGPCSLDLADHWDCSAYLFWA